MALASLNPTRPAPIPATFPCKHPHAISRMHVDLGNCYALPGEPLVSWLLQKRSRTRKRRCRAGRGCRTRRKPHRTRRRVGNGCLAASPGRAAKPPRRRQDGSRDLLELEQSVLARSGSRQAICIEAKHEVHSQLKLPYSAFFILIICYLMLCSFLKGKSYGLQLDKSFKQLQTICFFIRKT